MLPSPGKKKGSYKEILDENLDSLLNQAQCGDLNHHFLQLSHLTLTAEPHSCLSHSWSKGEEKLVSKYKAENYSTSAKDTGLPYISIGHWSFGVYLLSGT